MRYSCEPGVASRPSRRTGMLLVTGECATSQSSAPRTSATFPPGGGRGGSPSTSISALQSPASRRDSERDRLQPSPSVLTKILHASTQPLGRLAGGAEVAALECLANVACESLQLVCLLALESSITSGVGDR